MVKVLENLVAQCGVPLGNVSSYSSRLRRTLVRVMLLNVEGNHGLLWIVEKGLSIAAAFLL